MPAIWEPLAKAATTGALRLVFARTATLDSYGLETIAQGKFNGSGVPVTISTPDGIASVGRAVAHAERVGLAVGRGGLVALAVAVGVGVGIAVFVAVGRGVLVAVGKGVAVFVAVAVGVAVAVWVAVGDGVAVGVSVGVLVGVALGVLVGSIVAVWVGVAVGVAVAVLVAVGKGVGVAVADSVAVAVAVRVVVRVAVVFAVTASAANGVDLVALTVLVAVGVLVPLEMRPVSATSCETGVAVLLVFVAVGGSALVITTPAFSETEAAADVVDCSWPLAAFGFVLVLVGACTPFTAVLLWGVKKRVNPPAEFWPWTDCEKIKRTLGNKITIKMSATINPATSKRGDNSDIQRLSTTCTESGTRLTTSSMLMSIQVE